MKLCFELQIGQPALAKICAACPNALIHFRARVCTCSIVPLGRSASSWEIRIRDRDYNENSFNSCPNLQKCVLHLTGRHALSSSAFGRPFQKPKPMLRIVDVCVASMSHIDAILHVLTAKVDSLEQFTYKGPCRRLDLLPCLVHSQKKLAKVELHSRGLRCVCRGYVPREYEKQTAPFWVKIVSVFLQSNSLTDFFLQVRRLSRGPNMGPA